MKPFLATLAPFVLTLAFIATPAFAASGGEGGDRTPRRITSAETYIVSPDLSAPITSNYKFGGLLVVNAGYDIPDAKLRARAAMMMPRLTDALRTALATYTYSRFRPGGAPDADRIAEALQAAADRTLGQPGARVLLANVMVTKGR